MGATTAAIYVRVSSNLQEDNYSLATQEEQCRAYCVEHGYIISDALVFHDTHSGAEVWERPGLTRLREQIRAGEVQVVVAYAIDRLSRNQHHLGLLLSEAERYMVSLEFVTERLDDTPVGRFVRNALGFVADIEREKFKERSLRGRRARVQAGMPLHGQRPLYGYQWEKGVDRRTRRYLIDEAEAAIVRRIFHDMANGATLRGIAFALQAEGVPVPLAKRSRTQAWDATTIQRICRQPAYWGEATAFRYKIVPVQVRDEFSGEVRTVKRREMRPPEEQVSIAAAIPALVDKELAAVVHARLERNRTEAARRNRDPETTLLRGGFARCGYCGNAFVVSSRTGKYGGPAYRCGSKMHHVSDCGWHMISARNLDRAVWGKVVELLKQPGIIEQELARQQTADPSEADLEAIQHRLNEVIRQQGNLTRLAAQLPDPGEFDQLVGQLKSLKEAQRALEAERDQVLQRHEAWEQAQHRLGDLRRWCQAVSETIDEWTYAQKREVLYALGVRVLVYRRDHNPRYTIEASIPLDIPDRLTPDPTEGIVLSTRTGSRLRRGRR